MNVRLEERVIRGPGWHYRAAFGADGKIQLHDIYIDEKWIGSRRTEKQCHEAIPRERLQTAAICRLESDGNSCSHAPDSHASSQMGIPSGIQMSDAIH